MRCSFIIARDLRSAGTIKKERRNPNDPARFIGKVAVTEDGETAKIYNYLDTEKIEQEALYDGMYAVTTDLLDDDAKDILKVSEGRWEIEECFRIMKTDFETRPVFLRDDIRMKVDEHKCVSCGKCAKVCKMDVDVTKTPNSTECIRCGKCISACPTDAVSFQYGFGMLGKTVDENAKIENRTNKKETKEEL